MTFNPIARNFSTSYIKIKSALRQIGFVRQIYRLFRKENKFSSTSYEYLSTLSNDELLSLMRHESHRIEKTIYNNILEKKHDTYQRKWDKLTVIYQVLKARNFSDSEPTLIWSKKIYHAFNDLDCSFIKPNSLIPQEFQPAEVPKFVSFLSSRRSVRVWADSQPDQDTLAAIANQMIDAARWAPTSGNRQPWRFAILTEQQDKNLLKGIKEEHCTNAPLLIFVGMDSRVYGSLGQQERSTYIDAGAATMQMVLAAHKSGLGVCWNHFADDLIDSRESNKKIYANFIKELEIPEYITPIAIIAAGVPEFIPPQPARIDVENLIMHRS